MNSFTFIGPSGSGKGTQAGLLKKYLEQKAQKVLYIETGDEFRKFITTDSFSGRLSKKIYESDDRQPDFLASRMWANFITEKLTGVEEVIFDGTPRSLLEAKLLETAFLFYGFKNNIIIHLDVSREWSERHLLSRGRPDDKTISKIKKRLDWYHRDVLSAVEYFRSSPLCKTKTIFGEQPIESVNKDIMSFVSPLIS